ALRGRGPSSACRDGVEPALKGCENSGAAPRCAAATARRPSPTRSAAASWAPSDVGRILAVEEDPLPDFEVGEEPETIAVPLGAHAMLLRQPTQGRRPEEAAGERARPEDEFLDDRPELGSEPASDGDGESHLPPGEDRSGHAVGERRSQHRLRPPPTQLHARRDPEGVLDELV